jgi:hypothetical protein
MPVGNSVGHVQLAQSVPLTEQSQHVDALGLRTRRGRQFVNDTPTRHTDLRDRDHYRSGCICRFTVHPVVVV